MCLYSIFIKKVIVFIKKIIYLSINRITSEIFSKNIKIIKEANYSLIICFIVN